MVEICVTYSKIFVTFELFAKYIVVMINNKLLVFLGYFCVWLVAAEFYLNWVYHAWTHIYRL